MDDVVADTLLDVFQRNLAVRGVDADSRFYALGGDSLVAIRVVNGARARSVPITLRDLLVHQSVRGILSAPAVLARLAEAADGAADPAVTEAFGMLDPVRGWRRAGNGTRSSPSQAGRSRRRRGRWRGGCGTG